MIRPTFTCRNTLQRLRESHDERQRKEEDRNKVKIARVEYTMTRTGEDGKTVSVNKERILSELDSIDPEYIHQVLEQELQATEQPSPEKTSIHSSLVVTNITELQPTGDDDQM
ncbi:hypothetical protein [uncultured Nitrospira sp.]|uniref:hypothetical protein n=1 Tax=uncultured Nitrospira sp. TaxID=157176 RepID=UPI003140AD59